MANSYEPIKAAQAAFDVWYESDPVSGEEDSLSHRWVRNYAAHLLDSFKSFESKHNQAMGESFRQYKELNLEVARLQDLVARASRERIQAEMERDEAYREAAKAQSANRKITIDAGQSAVLLSKQYKALQTKDNVKRDRIVVLEAQVAVLKELIKDDRE